MSKKLEVDYNIDKLSIIYEIPQDFVTTMATQNTLMEYITNDSSTVFIFTKSYCSRKRIIPQYTLSYATGYASVLIGEINCDYENSITLNVDNEFLYSDKLQLLYEFEERFDLSFHAINKLDVCCDANQNLPRKLNDVLHSKDCKAVRRGRRKDITRKGNQVLGKKVSVNIKTLTIEERPAPSFYYYLKPSGCKQPIVLRCYHKSHEIDCISHKEYIRKALPFSGEIFRLEISTYWREITMAGKKNTNWTHIYIYNHITDKGFLSEFFRYYLDRFYNISIKRRKFTISQFLCLD